MGATRVFPIFSIAFAVIYALAIDFNWALFTYFPILRRFQLGAIAQTADTGPPMYWYGWLATSAIGAAIVAALGLLLPAGAGAKPLRTLSWAVPLVAMAYATWITGKIWGLF